MTHKGYRQSEEHKKRRSQSLKGRKMSKESISKAIASREGFRHSEETKRRMKEQRNSPEYRAMLSEVAKNRKKRAESSWNKGLKHSEESKEKMRQAQIRLDRIRGDKNPSKDPEVRKKISLALIGKKHSKETRAKMSRDRGGSGNNNWKGGISAEPYGIDWTETIRKAIRQRDKYQCQVCKKIQKRPRLDTHHIDYDKLNNDPNNLISLCKSCHAKTNFNRSVWKKKFRMIIVS